MKSEPPERDGPSLKITEKARGMILTLLSREEEPESLALWIEVGDSGDRRGLEMEFRPAAAALAGDTVQDHDGITLVIPQQSAERLKGPTVYITTVAVERAFSDDEEYESLDVIPAGASRASMSPAVGVRGLTPAHLSGDVAQRVMKVLEESINPAIAMHGGHADLVSVEGSTANLQLSGGCQGCGLATVTLTQGIAVAIKKAIPEIQNVVDVTDHSSGTNPFFQSSKK